MIEYIKGKIVEQSPAHVIIETNGLAYFLNVSLSSSSELKKEQECKLYIHEVIREDAHSLYAFTTKKEREIFRLLISVNGVGPNTARLILSSMTYEKLVTAVSTNDIVSIKSVKGIGLKTAQRIVIDLKDKISESSGVEGEFLSIQNNTLEKDSLSALTMLGFSKSAVQKVVSKIINENKDNQSVTVEDIVKQALNYL